MNVVGSAINYRTLEEVEAAFNPLRDKLIHSVEELGEVLRLSAARPIPFGMLHLVEGLEVETRRRSKARCQRS